MSMENWMSIDFGTSSSAAAIIRNGQPELVAPICSDEVGSKIFPTVVYIGENSTIYACHDAQRMKTRDNWRFLYEFKLAMDDNTIPGLNVTYTQVVTEVLKVLKEAAEKELDEKVENVILTVPATYTENDVKWNIMKQAARNAKFKNIAMLSEAQAAAIYYDFIEPGAQGFSFVFDLGGGTFDAAIIKHTDNKYQLIENSNGENIGGKFFTEKILNDYCEKTKTEPCLSVYEICENTIKRQLSYKDNFVDDKNNYSLSRKQFEAMISSDIEKMLQWCDNLIKKTDNELAANMVNDDNAIINADLKWKAINRIILIGGSCKVPLVEKKINSHLKSLGVENTRVVWKQTENGKKLEPQGAVALGAAVYAMREFMVPPKPPVTIGVLKRGSDGKIYSLKEGDNTFGRDTSMNFSFPEDEKMSRKHFSIEVTKKGDAYEYRITDLESTHGTVVGNMALTNRYSFAPQHASLIGGERIIAGDTRFEFLI